MGILHILYIFKQTMLSPISKAMAVECHFPSRILVQTRHMVWGSLRRLCLVTWSSSIRSLMVSLLTMSWIIMSYNKLMTSSCSWPGVAPLYKLFASDHAGCLLLRPPGPGHPGHTGHAVILAWHTQHTRASALPDNQRSHHNPVSRRQYHLLLDSFHTRQLGSRLSWPEVREVTLDLRDRLRDGARDTSLDPDDGVTMEERGEES